ncbi:hypothetical protein QCA50_013891 [Cerrena zonata]|uniref:Uncharacterized protein n=1 Tax=Cerrena zonata TaxID=2478898 RepID=A0AAW0FQ86_9APHY
MLSIQTSDVVTDAIQNPSHRSPTAVPTVQITPSTPIVRGRISSRYPSNLGKGEPGRVPLHRRGKSRTYERLEDLLREAGYKETRVFTPESERAEARAEERRAQRAGSLRGGVDAFVGFLAGWIPGAAKNGEDTDPRSTNTSGDEDSLHEVRQSSMPPSPLAHKRPGTPDSLHSIAVRNAPRYSSASPRVRLHQLPGEHALPHPTRQTLRHQLSATSSLRQYAQVSAARSHLRHMASAPHMPKPSSKASSIRRKPISSISEHSNRLSSSAAASSTQLLAPYSLTSYLQRAPTAPGEVTTVRVFCRSAPASRSSSRAGERLNRATNATDRGFRGVPRKNRNGKGKDKEDFLPSLADNQLEGERWDVQWVNGKRLSISGSSDIPPDTDSSDDDGELDLARLLVPAKRQNSIRSLRKHLHRTESLKALRHQANYHRALDSWAYEDDDDGLSSNRASTRERRLSRRQSMDEDSEYGYEAMGLPGFDQVGAKRRRGLPVWSLGGGGR